MPRQPAKPSSSTRTANGRDPLALAAVVAILVIGAVVIVDLLTDGAIDPSILTLLIGCLAPLTPALIVRYREKR